MIKGVAKEYFNLNMANIMDNGSLIISMEMVSFVIQVVAHTLENGNSAKEMVKEY